MTVFQNRYAPKDFGDLIFADPNTRQRLKDFADNKRHNSIIFHGPYGTAKSTTARILVEERTRGIEFGGVDFYRGGEVDQKTRSLIERTWMIEQLSGVQIPVSVVDEVDTVPENVQYAFRSDIDTRADRGCFIFTTNKIHRVDHGLVDRCDVIELPAANTDHWRLRAQWILAQEGVAMPYERLEELLATCDGSIRDLLRALEDAVLHHRRKAA